MNFFGKRRKLFLFAAIYMLLYSFFEIYSGIEAISKNHNGKGTGIMINAAISMCVAIYIFVQIRPLNGKTEKANISRSDELNTFDQ